MRIHQPVGGQRRVHVVLGAVGAGLLLSATLGGPDGIGAVIGTVTAVAGFVLAF